MDYCIYRKIDTLSVLFYPYPRIRDHLLKWYIFCCCCPNLKNVTESLKKKKKKKRYMNNLRFEKGVLLSSNISRGRVSGVLITAYNYLQ